MAASIDRTWTYQGPSDAGVFADPLSEVRFLSKDLEDGPYSLSDQEIRYLLARSGDSVYEAAARAAEARASAYASAAKKQVTVGPFSITTDLAGQAADLRGLAAWLRSGGASGGGMVVSLPDSDDPTLPLRPIFQLGQTDGRGLLSGRRGY